MKTPTAHIIVDVETDGPIPSLYSMLAIGAVQLVPKKDGGMGVGGVFGRTLRPWKDAKWQDEALAVCGWTREQTLDRRFGAEPWEVMRDFHGWIGSTKEAMGAGHCVMWSDNPAFDWQFVNWYSHVTMGSNPLGFSARRIGDLAAGVMRNPRFQWKKWRVTAHDHNPVNDAMGNAEALIRICSEGGFTLYPKVEF